IVSVDAFYGVIVETEFENQKELSKMQLDNQKEIAEMQNETQKEIAGIQSATSRQNTKDQVYAQNEMLAYQQKEDRKSGSAGMPRPISYAVFCLKKKKKKNIKQHQEEHYKKYSTQKDDIKSINPKIQAQYVAI